MKEEVFIYKPVFLLDNQKTLTMHIDPVQNKNHQQPTDFSEREALITRRILDIFRDEYRRYSSSTIERRFEGVMSQLSWLGMVLSRDIDPDSLVVTPNRDWQAISADLFHAQILDSPVFHHSDPVSDWKITPEARGLMEGIKESLGCHQLVVSGILSRDIDSLNQSFRKQGVIDYLSGPKFLLRADNLTSTHLHKAFVHGALINLGFTTVAIDDDKNTIETIQRFVGCPAVLVSTPEEVKDYRGIKGTDFIKDPLCGPLFQKGIDGDNLFELARCAYREVIG